MAQQSNHRQPNIVLIVLDSVRRDHLSCYGYARMTTPHIDRLAQEGVQFERAYSTSCWTIPAHASIFTGLYPSQHRADFDTRYLASNHTTLAQQLKARDYRTACISCNSFVAGGFTNLNQGFALTIDVEGGYRGGKDHISRALRSVHKRWRHFMRRDRGAQQATRLACRWLARQDEPFFLFMNYMDCHLPYRLRRPARYRFVAPEDRARVDDVPLDPFAVMAGRIALSVQQIADLQALYDGCLFYLDSQIGRLVACLKELGQYNRTIFIVTADHGESFGEKGLFDHQYALYEHLVAVPFIVRLPGAQAAGLRNQALFQHVDLMPALIKMVRVQADKADSLDATRLLAPGRDVILTEYLVPNLRPFRRRFPDVDMSRYESAQRAIYHDGYKLIAWQDGRLALYDMARDPGEMENLAETKPVRARELLTRLLSLLGPWPKPVAAAPDIAEGAEIRERLKTLGYL